jgi:outer membrane protein OmpA-like peptidoglycan-associated protein
VAHQVLMDLAFSLGVWKHFQLGAQFQAVLHQTGDDAADLGFAEGPELKALALADLRLLPKIVLLQPKGPGLGLAFLPILTFPTATSGANAGENGLTVEPRLIVDWRLRGGALIVGQAGYRWREGAEVANLRVDDELVYGFGAEVPLLPRVSIIGEVFGAVGLYDSDLDEDSGVDLEEAPAEGLIAGRWRHESGWIVTGGVGTGLTLGYGSPRVRVFVSAGYSPSARPLMAPKDTDGDGIPDTADKCPTEPEDKNGFEDQDGCPDGARDTDGDGIPDKDDKCPTEPEDMNGFEDTDGCPDGARDTDGDGIPDAKDKCPTEPEDKNGFEDEDGCPDANRDTDKDGIPDAKDQCPAEAEDQDGFEDADGCPDPDNDGDGFCDPWVVEKGLQEKYSDTCKGTDKCPDEKEIINGFEDEDGCPDKGQEKVQITKSGIIVLDKIFFKTAKADLLPQSFPILDMVVSVMKTHTQIELVEVQGHTDDVGDDDRNLKLSDDRTKSVMNYLVSKGVDAKRLTQKGYGETMPIADCRTLKRKALDECRGKNRRVEFKILRMGKAKGE